MWYIIKNNIILSCFLQYDMFCCIACFLAIQRRKYACLLTCDATSKKICLLSLLLAIQHKKYDHCCHCFLQLTVWWLVALVLVIWQKKRNVVPSCNMAYYALVSNSIKNPINICSMSSLLAIRHTMLLWATTKKPNHCIKAKPESKQLCMWLAFSTSFFEVKVPRQSWLRWKSLKGKKLVSIIDNIRKHNRTRFHSAHLVKCKKRLEGDACSLFIDGRAVITVHCPCWWEQEVTAY